MKGSRHAALDVCSFHFAFTSLQQNLDDSNFQLFNVRSSNKAERYYHNWPKKLRRKARAPGGGINTASISPKC